MVQTFALDSRLPVPEGMSDSDPSHPANVMRNAQIVQNQAVADTKYDPYPPPRLTKDESEQKEKEKGNKSGGTSPQACQNRRIRV
jgi:hypothetical protein